ncbi:MAG: alpha/beta fold hydrolase [Succinivibrionaceae bacterium]
MHKENFYTETDDKYLLNTYKFSPENKVELGCVLLVLGKGEIVYKYYEFINFLVNLGFVVISYDHRGQGFNERLSNVFSVCHIESFNYYENDLEKVISILDFNKKCYMISVSMGATVTLSLLKKNIIPKFIDKIVFISPFVGIKTWCPNIIIKFLIFFQKIMYKILNKSLDNFFYGQRSFSVEYANKKMKTHDLNNHKKYYKLYNKYPNAKLGGVSVKWMDSVLSTIDKIKNGNWQINKNILCFIAIDDNVVSSKDAEEFFKNHKNDNFYQKIVFLLNSYHDVLIEKQNIIDIVKKEVISFLK